MLFRTVINIAHVVALCSGLFCNIFLIFLALFKSPRNMRVYVVLIVNFAFFDLFACVLDYMTEARVIPAKNTIAYISMGTCTYFGPFVCWTLFGCMLTCLTHSLFALCYSFYFRYRILHSDSMGIKKVIFSLSLILIPSVLQTIGYIHSYADPELVRTQINKEFPEYNITGLTVTGFKDLRDPISWIPILNCVVPVPGVYCLIFYFRYKIMKYLKDHTKQMSNETRAVHSQFLKVLTYQAGIPLFMLFGMGLFALGMFDLMHNEIQEHLTVMFNIFFPVLSPLGYIMFLKRYRSQTVVYLKRLTCKRTIAVKSSSMQMNSITRNKVSNLDMF